MKVDERSMITCPMCGTEFDPAGRATCHACPLQNGCTLVCCPNCGHSTVDPSASLLARGASKLLTLLVDGNQQPLPQPSLAGQEATAEPAPQPSCPLERTVPLTQLPAGGRGVVADLGEAMPANRRQAMLAYGLMPGKLVRVLQQTPLTVLRVDRIELALETELAAMIEIEPLQPRPLPSVGA